MDHRQPDLPAACAYLLAMPQFGEFLDAIREMRDQSIRDAMTNVVEDFQTFAGYRAKYLAFNEVLEMAEFQAAQDLKGE